MILITEFMDAAAVASLEEQFGAVYRPDLAETQAAIPALLADKKALIVRNRTQVTAELLDAAPGLACVGRLGVGLDNIDQPACAARDVTVYPATGANNLSVAEYVIATAMMLLRGAYQRNDQMLAGDWPRGPASGREIAGKVLGLVGFGAIARDTAALARGLGMEIIGYDPFLPEDHPAWDGATRAELPDLLAQSDVVSLHVPLTDGTRHIIGAEALAGMKDDAILINAARGGVVDEAALAVALKAGTLGGAALDVFETEPLTAEARARFADVPNLVLSPHIGGVTVESNTRVSAMIAEVVARHLSR
ncbi:hydroxyacid dehydrogenase [Primorskyibacter aestuariivivens]|uniref:hydroxyacid dehydrogenase n=1 Tax=Primorskyibacter aestuariivivens TaxID=1888912 RepID=UPI00230017AE|nr:hydroxyacid dehydrogenase [Primorskyibacter aestuariivivens]MDA7427944.1 hydroxyacid dehydrogenase [Primorskyibacter aestuariivivens]